jgi:GNAT superfamily N-acetyltransferase
MHAIVMRCARMEPASMDDRILDDRTLDDRTLLDLGDEASSIFDARGRILHSNSPDQLPPPRLALTCTATCYRVNFGASVPDNLAHELAAIVERERPDGTLTIPADLQTRLRTVLERHAPIEEEGGGPGYLFPESVVAPEHVVQITEENVDLARETFPWMLREFAGWAPYFAVVEGGVVASVCFNARSGPRAAEAGLYTHPEYRGRGYAADVTRAWGAATRARGRVPLYSTSWDNLASQAVARKVGLIQYSAGISWT